MNRPKDFAAILQRKTIFVDQVLSIVFETAEENKHLWGSQNMCFLKMSTCLIQLVYKIFYF